MPNGLRASLHEERERTVHDREAHLTEDENKVRQPPCWAVEQPHVLRLCCSVYSTRKLRRLRFQSLLDRSWTAALLFCYSHRRHFIFCSRNKTCALTFGSYLRSSILLSTLRGFLRVT